MGWLLILLILVPSWVFRKILGTVFYFLVYIATCLPAALLLEKLGVTSGWPYILVFLVITLVVFGLLPKID